MKKERVTRLATLGVLTALALVLSYVESLLPPLWPAVPGIKIGLPNIVIILLLYKLGVKEAAIVSVIRIFFASFILFGNVTTLFYSLAGAALSLALMTLCKKLNLFSTVGVSVVGGISHNLGQILVAIAIFDTTRLGYYMIVLTVTGTVAGVFIGVAGAMLLKRLEKVKM